MTQQGALRILVVEDDMPVAMGLMGGLRDAGFDPVLAMDGAVAAPMGLDESVALILLDLMLPERDGFELLEAWSGRISKPVIVLSARTELQSRLRSFELGAVDFVPKPFFMEELVARIRTRLAVRPEGPARQVAWADVVVDLDAREVRRAGHSVPLTPNEFAVLAYLVDRPGRALSRVALSDGALAEQGDRRDRTVDSHISRIRKKLGADAATSIETVWGIGWRFNADATFDADAGVAG